MASKKVRLRENTLAGLQENIDFHPCPEVAQKSPYALKNA